MVNASELKTEIKRNGLTQEKLAKKIGMNPSTLNVKINGKRGAFSIDEAQKIVNELKLSDDRAAHIFFARKLAYTQERT